MLKEKTSKILYSLNFMSNKAFQTGQMSDIILRHSKILEKTSKIITRPLADHVPDAMAGACTLFTLNIRELHAHSNRCTKKKIECVSHVSPQVLHQHISLSCWINYTQTLFGYKFIKTIYIHSQTQLHTSYKINYCTFDPFLFVTHVNFDTLLFIFLHPVYFYE